jgi:hypothetical protein
MLPVHPPWSPLHKNCDLRFSPFLVPNSLSLLKLANLREKYPWTTEGAVIEEGRAASKSP